MPSPDLPEGVIAPYEWRDREIPISGAEATATATDKHVIDSAVTEAMRQYGVVGCGICVVRFDRVIYSRGFGYAELPDKPFTTDTASRCGSLAKPITALCALLLADQGKLDLDAKLVPLLKRAGIVPSPVGSAQIDDRIDHIKVRHLMDHTSGLPGGATYTAWRPGRNVAELHSLTHPATAADVAADSLGNFRLDSEPGAKYQYANANFVLLARIIEAKSGMPFNKYLTNVAIPAFGLSSSEIYLSRNQDSAHSYARGKNEAAYYQTSAERYFSYLPEEQANGQVYGEAYRGYATEAADGGGGIACTAQAIGKIIANLHSQSSALSQDAMREILTPPDHYLHESGFSPDSSSYYCKGWKVCNAAGRPWLAHGGMTNHCGGVIGHNAGFQFVAVSNWNNTGQPYIDVILNNALCEAVAKLGPSSVL